MCEISVDMSGRKVSKSRAGGKMAKKTKKKSLVSGAKKWLGQVISGKEASDAKATPAPSAAAAPKSAAAAAPARPRAGASGARLAAAPLVASGPSEVGIPEDGLALWVMAD